MRLAESANSQAVRRSQARARAGGILGRRAVSLSAHPNLEITAQKLVLDPNMVPARTLLEMAGGGREEQRRRQGKTLGNKRERGKPRHESKY